MREIFLIRHGDAEPMNPGGDRERTLTPSGRTRIEAVGRGLASIVELAAGQILHSPYVRARQTAQLLQPHIGGVCSEEGGIVPGADVEEATMALGLVTGGPLVVVSHLPLLPGIAAHLLGGGRFEVGTGTVLHLACEGRTVAKGTCTLLGLFHAGHFERCLRASAP